MADNGPGGLFSLATAPARLVGWFRPALAASLRVDARAYSGPRRSLFAVLAVVAVGYPLVASIIHATIGVQPEGEFLAWALAPYFTFVYTESLPFMIAVIGIGAFSPALGVLLLAVFIPADLLATAIAFPGGNQFQPPLTAAAARLLSHAVLWLLAVEIPLVARGWSGRVRERQDPSAPYVRAFVQAAGTAVLVALWSSSVVWLIQPVIYWTVLGSGGLDAGAYLPLRMTMPVWTFGWILVLGAAVVAFAAGSIVRPGDEQAAEESQPAQFRLRGLPGELLRVVMLAVLLSGVMFDWLQAGLIVGGALLAGPVLTRILPSVPVPSVISRTPPVVRWAAAPLLAGGTTLLVLAVVPAGQVADYLLLAVILAVLMPLGRIVVYVGRAPRPSAAPVPGVGPVAGALLRLLAVMALWLTFPALVLAHDGNEQGTVWQYVASVVGFGAAAALAGAAGGDPSDPKPVPRPKPGPVVPPTPYGPPGGKPPNPWGTKKETTPEPDNPFRWWKPWTWFG